MALWFNIPAPDSTQEGRSLSVNAGAYALSADPGGVPLKRFRQALASADTAGMNWWALGDSYTEGTAASTLDNTYMWQVLRVLQKRLTSAGRGGFGYLNAGTTFASTPTWAYSGGGANGDGTAVWAGKRRVFAAGETATLTFVGTSFIIGHRAGDASSIPYTVTTDGGAPVTVTPSTTGGFATTGQYTSPTLARATHTVVLAPVNPANVMAVWGATLFDGDETSGIHLYTHGIHGATATSYLAGLGASFTSQQVVAPNPALVTLMLGVNDFNLGVVPATMQADLTSIIANVKSACTLTPSFLLIVPPQFNKTSPAFPWTSYVNAVKGVAAADPTNVAVLDLTDHFIDVPVSGNSFTHGLMNADQIHPSDAGHQFIAQLVVQRLLGIHQPTSRAVAVTADITTAIAPKANDSAVVHLTGNETVAGTKTFSSSPTVPDTPASGVSAANKNYVLSVASSGGIPLATVTTKGDLVAGTASATVARVGIGSDTQILIADSSQTAGMKWGPPAAAPTLTPTATKTSAYTAVAGDLVIGDASGGAFVVTLPAAATGNLLAIRKGDSSANAITYNAAGTDTIGIVNPVTSGTLALSGQVVTLLGYVGGWVPVSGLKSLSSLDARYGRLPDVQVFTSAGTWTKPTGALTTTVTLIGGGGGGGSGRMGAAGTVRCGGGGGAGAGREYFTLPTSSLGATEAVAVGVGGTGGVAVTTSDTNGNIGAVGATSTFGVRGSGFVAQTRTSGAGSGGTNASGTAGPVSTAGVAPGAIGGAASTTGAVGGGGGDNSMASSGGGGGGGITSADSPSAGGASGRPLVITTSSAGGGAINTGGTAGIAADANSARPGSGGGGGGGSITGNGGTGGVGGIYGAGGGGGGAALNGNNSGAGGAGGNGIVLVISQ